MSDYILECIEGIIQQETNFSFEIIAIDDASTDDSLEIMQDLSESYSSILRVFNNDVNLGLAGTMKRLLRLASGDYIAYLDGDDIALPGKLMKQSDYLDRNKTCTIVYHESDVFDCDTDKTLWTYTKDYYNHSYIPKQATVEHVIQYGCFMQASTVMVRRHNNMIDAVDENNVILHDHPWHVLNLLYGKGSIDFIAETLGRYRIHRNSFGARTLRSIKRREQVLEDQLNVCSLASSFGVSYDVVQAGIRHYAYATALYFLRAKEFKLFYKYLNQSTNGVWFFDEKHIDIWKRKKEASYLVDKYY